MSLILDALKKLDRDKRSKAYEGVVLLASTPWSTARASQTLLATALIVAGLALLVAAALTFWSRADNTPRNTPSDTKLATAPPSSLPRASLPDVPPSSPLTIPNIAESNRARVDLRPSPTAPSESPTRTPSPYRLNAIGLHDGQPVAVLNDRLVREGDQFDGITVIRIDDTKVEIEVDGRRVLVNF